MPKCCLAIPAGTSGECRRSSTPCRCLQRGNGRPDSLGGAADGALIETSHVTIQGLRVLGMPVVESPQAGQIKRLYAISRLRRDLDDVEIGQCLFVGDDETAPNHVGIIANGNGVNVHHCIFRGLKISVVYWTPGSSGHAMTHCLCHNVYGSGVWTAGISSDFVYRNNVVDSGNYVWTAQGGASALADAGGRGGRQGAAAPAAAPTARRQPQAAIEYRIVGSYFANNRRLAGSGTGARLQYADIDPSFLTLVDTKVTDQPVALESDSTKLDYLHPVAGSEAAKIGAGLFAEADLLSRTGKPRPASRSSVASGRPVVAGIPSAPPGGRPGPRRVCRSQMRAVATLTANSAGPRM